ncbi:MAG TPA: tRNA (adenosine(37)-N6)-dimethylallyltransferase MiaA [Tepidisphaeraceae bacterium]|nr:tRNA (adenosine(37)-N6)-dimethylallyltransferase MiaA [Tepidisphaeraceae bacterium]
MPDSSRILVILGPTASGKSALAIALARRTGAEILSVDSMQVYQGMNIGTAKPSLAEQHEIRHHLINWVRPDEDFSVARFCELAEGVIADVARRGRPLIATGGTPLYFKSLFFGLFDGPGADPAIRQRLGELDGATLHSRLAEIDPAAAARIHAADRKRLIRALEIYELTGKPISSLQTHWDNSTAPRHPSVWIGLHWEKEELNHRINARVKDMIAAGWVEEVAELLRSGRPLSRTAAEATGYSQLVAYLQGKCSLEEAVEQIKIATRQLARRQMKWIRRFPGVTWLEGNVGAQQSTEDALKAWQAP